MARTTGSIYLSVVYEAYLSVLCWFLQSFLSGYYGKTLNIMCDYNLVVISLNKANPLPKHTHLVCVKLGDMHGSLAM